MACLSLERRGIHILIVVLHDSSMQSGRALPPRSPFSVAPPPPGLLPVATAKFTSPLLLPQASRASRWDSITLGPTGGESCERWQCPSWPCFHSPANDIHLLPSCPNAPPHPILPLLHLRSPFYAVPQAHSRLPQQTSPSSTCLPSLVSTLTLVPLQLQPLSSREQGVSGG